MWDFIKIEKAYICGGLFVIFLSFCGIFYFQIPQLPTNLWAFFDFLCFCGIYQKYFAKNPTKYVVGCGLFSIFDVGVATYYPTSTCGLNSSFNQKPGQIYAKIAFLVEGSRFWEFLKFFETFWSCLGILGRFLEKLKTHSQKIVKNDQIRPKIHKKQKAVPKSDQQ